MAEASKRPIAKRGKPKKSCGCLVKSLALVFLVLILGVLFGPISGGIRKARILESMSNANFIAMGLADYAMDHHGQYPTGNSSTELFQKLLDGGYINDPYVFCWVGWMYNRPDNPYSGNLRSKDVCYDVTVPLGSTSPDHLPIVFMTGFKVSYSPGGRAVPLHLATEPPHGILMVVTYQDKIMAVFPSLHPFGFGRGDYYIPELPDNSRAGKTGPLWPGDNYVPPVIHNHWPSYGFADPQRGKLGGKALADGTVIDFVPADFNSEGKKYQQLTPDGVLGP